MLAGLLSVLVCSLCSSGVRQHYVEYLVRLINQHQIDPLSVYEGSEMIAALRRMAIDVPERLEFESDADFYGRCAQVTTEHPFFNSSLGQKYS